ncbi:MAG TPA: hypothetical protein VLD19_10135, partial [Chitinophagaceae bacterium]|nr:hypothetical protein [Chitinophagaceae bacterium]
HAGTKSPWDDYLCRHFSMKPDEVKEVIATNYTRDYRFGDALQWLQQIKDPELLKLELNPFGDPLLDRSDTVYTFDKGYFSKPAFIREMHRLQRLDQQGKASAKELYKLANGYYNITFYGRAWQTVKFYRPGTQGFDITPSATAFEREYYCCYTAERCFRKAMQAGTDNNFRARCLFMMAKCAQKQAVNIVDSKDSFFHSKYFPRLVKEYGNTPFYKEAFSTCSYLRDFVKKNK